MIINQDIKNLVSGISQQPPVLRHPEQLEEQVNGFSTEASGLQKRPPSIFIKSLRKYNKAIKPYVHLVDRDKIEQYCMVFDGTDIYVYDLEGNAKTVTYVEDKSYIQTTDPRANLKVISIADYTFIVNTTITASMYDSITSRDYWDTQGLLVNIKSGQYGRKYRIMVNNNTQALFETPDGSSRDHAEQISTDYIVSKLKESAEANGWTCTTGSSWLYMTGMPIESFAVYDGFNNQAAFGFTKSAQKFSNLPASAPNNFVVKILGEEGSTTDDYYVRYDAIEHAWIETIRPNIPYTFNLYTMPHVLVREADGSFTFKRAAWSPREVGDEESNPVPSFVGEKINDICYHRNRLCFLAGENVILSRSADFYNFWMQSATKVQDTDPIDVAASDNTIVRLYNAVAYDSDLLLFSKTAQFKLHANGVLTPKDVILSQAVTHYEASLKAKPVNAGRNVYFVAERAKYTTVREFFTADDNTEQNDVQDITSHCPNYIPNGVYKIIPSTVENIMLYLTEGEEDAIYVYKYLFTEGRRVQTSWSKWEMQDKIYGGAFIDKDLYLVVLRNNCLCLEKVVFTFNTIDFEHEPYRIFLDSKRAYTIPNNAYNSLTDTTNIDLRTLLGDLYDSSKVYGAVASDGVYVVSKDGKFEFIGDYRNVKISYGIVYNFKVVMSPVMVKQSEQGNTIALTDGRLQLRYMWFNYSDSGAFRISVDNKDKSSYIYTKSRQTFMYDWTSRQLGTLNSTLDNIIFTTGSYRFPVQGKSLNMIVTLESDNPLPLSLVGAGWIGNYVRRSRLFQ